jgi:hypothetical protein
MFHADQATAVRRGSVSGLGRSSQTRDRAVGNLMACEPARRRAALLCRTAEANARGRNSALRRPPRRLERAVGSHRRTTTGNSCGLRFEPRLESPLRSHIAASRPTLSTSPSPFRLPVRRRPAAGKHAHKSVSAATRNRAMARPGLEPGTPRFSGLRAKVSNKPKSLHRFWTSREGRRSCDCRYFRTFQ